MDPKKLDRLKKFIGMFGSDNDGEALNAIRMAGKILADEKLSWSQLADRLTIATAAPAQTRVNPARPQGSGYAYGYSTPNGWFEDMFRDAFNEDFARAARAAAAEAARKAEQARYQAQARKSQEDIDAAYARTKNQREAIEKARRDAQAQVDAMHARQNANKSTARSTTVAELIDTLRKIRNSNEFVSFTDWERVFIIDLVSRFDKYKGKIDLSAKQTEIVNKMVSKFHDL